MQSSGNHPEQKEGNNKLKRNRSATECSVKRRKSGCGICGSENIAIQGVLYCEICGEESYYITEYSGAWRQDYNTKVNCNCTEKWEFKGRTREYRKIKNIGVLKCLDCGSVGNSRLCPNNGPNHGFSYSGPSTCWKHWCGEIFCQECGFRIGGDNV